MSDLNKEAARASTQLFIQNLVKLIPAEILALYIVVKGFIPVDANAISAWIVIGLFIVLVPFYLVFAAKVKNFGQVALMTVSTVGWMFALGGAPFDTITWLQPWMFSAIMAVLTLAPPIFMGQRLEAPAALSTAAGAPKGWREV
jgi:hypothetical protein